MAAAVRDGANLHTGRGGDAPDHGQPQPVPVAAGHPRFEDPVDVSGIEPGSVIQDVDHDGPGIDPADVDRVFEAGVTGGGGYGLGLPVVRRIAASAGVEVRAIADGRGHVEVTLPAARATA